MISSVTSIQGLCNDCMCNSVFAFNFDLSLVSRRFIDSQEMVFVFCRVLMQCA